jgi:hypothetical protein
VARHNGRGGKADDRSLQHHHMFAFEHRVSLRLDERIHGQRDVVELAGKTVIPPGEEKYYSAVESLRWREKPSSRARTIAATPLMKMKGSHHERPRRRPFVRAP